MRCVPEVEDVNDTAEAEATQLPCRSIRCLMPWSTARFVPCWLEMETMPVLCLLSEVVYTRRSQAHLGSGTYVCTRGDAVSLHAGQAHDLSNVSVYLNSVVPVQDGLRAGALAK